MSKANRKYLIFKDLSTFNQNFLSSTLYKFNTKDISSLSINLCTGKSGEVRRKLLHAHQHILHI